jgi:endonuclease YncB( thermonuclease family)
MQNISPANPRMNKSRAVLTLATAMLLCGAPACRRPSVRTEIRTAPSPTKNQTNIIGRVVRIADGDTLTVLDAMNVQHRIRLQGIDAPESHQAFGTQSKKNLSDLVFDKEVTAICDKADQYGRLVCKIMLGDKDINLEQVKAGMAWHYKDYQREQSAEDRDLYARAENEAHAARWGLWIDTNPTEPSEFRREEKRERDGK